MDLRRLNPFWRQLPVYSPVTFRSLWAGLAGALGFGDPLTRLRELLTEEYGCRDLILTDSGTSALRLAIEGAIEETGSDIVALPAYCCYDVATAAVGANARMALYDVRPETLGPDFDALRATLEAGARTVVVAHLFGLPVDLDRSRTLCEEFKAVLIEDAAQGSGGFWRGRPLGSHGSLAVLSFGRGKGRTGGGGGALLANDAWGERTIGPVRETPRAGGRGLLAILKLTAQWLFGRPSLYGIPASCPVLGLGETAYKEPREPAGMANGPAAALLANWEASKREEEWRRRSFAGRGARILSVNRMHLELPGGVPGFLRLPVPATDCTNEGRSERLGIVRGYPRALSAFAIPGGRRFGSSRCEGAEELASVLCTAPTHSRTAGSPAYLWSVGPSGSEFPDADGSTPSEPT